VRLRQGFGRLMRRSTDGGAVLILDTRVVKRFYGRAFLESLPPATLTVSSSRAVLRAMGDFLQRIR
jgi:ATP-dependent DNA helicase DinG